MLAALTVRGKSHPWPFSTEHDSEKAEVFQNQRPRPPAAVMVSKNWLKRGNADD
jgi:hypothetical protein